MTEEYSYLVFESDAWLSRNAMTLMAVCTNEEDAIQAILDNHAFKVSDFFEQDEEDDVENLKQDMQEEIERELREHYQIRAGETSYIIIPVENNTWDDCGIA